MNEKISETLEHYLGTIRSLEAPEGSVRSTDIASALGVSRPSVHTAVDRLSRMGLVRHDRYSRVSLTESGRTSAEEILERRRMARRLLEDIPRRSPEIRRAEVCAIEHLSRETLSALVDRMDNRPGPA